MKKRSALTLVLFILVAEAAGLAGAFFLGGIDGWYVSLQKPFFSPPNWLFGPVWTALYAFMGIAAYLVWQKGDRIALRPYWVQLAANAAWTPLFFGLQSPILALIDILLLLVLIAVTIRMFASVSHTAALLLAPYFLWVSFATILNFSIWYLN